ncbi:hypothetical protein K3495_g8052 [Podosphaera aphanis]|nr:hypothetical protein K3495_g8052 [Podosphaera aphanis]
MVQGSIKRKTAKATLISRRSNVLGPKKGARTIAPRRQALVRQDKMTKKHSAGLTAMTERTLGAKVGHLELLGGGKNGKGKDVKEKKSKETPRMTGGTKKFG